MNQAGLQMLHDMYLDTGNTTGFWEALKDYRRSSTYRLVCSRATPLCCLLLVFSHRDFLCNQASLQGRQTTLRCVGMHAVSHRWVCADTYFAVCWKAFRSSVLLVVIGGCFANPALVLVSTGEGLHV